MHINPNDRIDGITANRKEAPPIIDAIVINDRSKLATTIILRYSLELLRISLLNKPTKRIDTAGSGYTLEGTIINAIISEKQTMIADKGVGLRIPLLLSF